MKKPILIIASFVIFLAGCKLDTTGLPTGTANASAGLLLGKWYFKSVVTAGTVLGLAVSNTEADYTTQDYYIFNKDLSLDVSEITDGNGTSVGSYSYSSSTQQLTFTDQTGATETASVLKLTADSLVFSYTVSVPALGTQTTITNHFAH